MKKTHIIGIIIIAVAIGVIMGTMTETTTFVTFSEASMTPGREYQVVGKLNKEKPMEYNPEVNANRFTFYLVDNDSIEQQVVFNGSKPQDFERAEQVVLTGKMEGEQFIASKILMKCPSKYNDGKNVDEFQEFNAQPG